MKLAFWILRLLGRIDPADTWTQPIQRRLCEAMGRRLRLRYPG